MNPFDVIGSLKKLWVLPDIRPLIIWPWYKPPVKENALGLTTSL